MRLPWYREESHSKIKNNQYLSINIQNTEHHILGAAPK